MYRHQYDYVICDLTETTSLQTYRTQVLKFNNYNYITILYYTFYTYISFI